MQRIFNIFDFTGKIREMQRIFNNFDFTRNIRENATGF